MKGWTGWPRCSRNDALGRASNEVCNVHNTTLGWHREEWDAETRPSGFEPSSSKYHSAVIVGERLFLEAAAICSAVVGIRGW